MHFIFWNNVLFFRIRYEIFVMVVYFLALFMGPIESAFSRKSKERFMKKYYPLQTAVDVLCQVDVTMNFFTGYMVKNSRKIELQPFKIFKWVKKIKLKTLWWYRYGGFSILKVVRDNTFKYVQSWIATICRALSIRYMLQYVPEMLKLPS